MQEKKTEFSFVWRRVSKRWRCHRAKVGRWEESRIVSICSCAWIGQFTALRAGFPLEFVFFECSIESSPLFGYCLSLHLLFLSCRCCSGAYKTPSSHQSILLNLPFPAGLRAFPISCWCCSGAHKRPPSITSSYSIYLFPLVLEFLYLLLVLLWSK